MLDTEKTEAGIQREEQNEVRQELKLADRLRLNGQDACVFRLYSD